MIARALLQKVPVQEATPVQQEPSDEQKALQPVVRHGAVCLPLPVLTSGAPHIVEIPKENGGVDYDVFVYGVIGGITMKAANMYTDLIQLLDTATAETVFRFYICSGGGQVHEATQVAAAMKNTKAHVITRATGPCASAAVVLWMSGKERQFDDGAYLMQHMSAHTDFSDSAAIGLLANSLVRYIIDIVLTPMVEIGLLTEQEFSDITDKRKSIWLDADTVRTRLNIGGAA